MDEESAGEKRGLFGLDSRLGTAGRIAGVGQAIVGLAMPDERAGVSEGFCAQVAGMRSFSGTRGTMR